MKFGKVSDPDQISFRLPSSPLSTNRLLSNLSIHKKETFFHIGCTGWSMKEWIGKIYPAGTQSKQYLYHYSRQFNTIELNTTHYRIPTPATIKEWYQQTPEDFRFCPKIPQSISHSSNFAAGSGKLQHFCEAVQGLEKKLGPCFIQLPPYFHAGRKEDLNRFLDRWPGNMALAVEFRHPSWFEKEESFEPMAQVLEERKVGTVITDVAGRRDVLHQRLTTPIAFIRFVGNGLHPTDYTRIDEWIEQLVSWMEAGLQEVYFFPHEPDNILAPELSVYLAKQLEKKQANIRFRTPRLLDPKDGKQMELF
jgi:uncharacterized protein YecE (DUF72 family)